MKYFLTLILSFFIVLGNFVLAQIPSTNLQLWLRADSVHLNGATVDTIYDCSLNHFNATQNNSSLQPQKINNIALLNNKPVLRFDGINDAMRSIFTSSFTQPNTIFIVWNVTGTDANAAYTAFDGLNTSNRQMLTSYNSLISLGADVSIMLSYSKNVPFKYLLNSLVSLLILLY